MKAVVLNAEVDILEEFLATVANDKDKVEKVEVSFS